MTAVVSVLRSSKDSSGSMSLSVVLSNRCQLSPSASVAKRMVDRIGAHRSMVNGRFIVCDACGGRVSNVVGVTVKEAYIAPLSAAPSATVRP